jgi:hypothetical protein
MPIIESTPKRLVIKSGSTTFTLDREVAKLRRYSNTGRDGIWGR